MKARHLIVTTLLLGTAMLATAATAIGSPRSADNIPSVLDAKRNARDPLSEHVRAGLFEQGLDLEKLVKLGEDGGDTFWVGRAPDKTVCLVTHHRGAGSDWASAAGCVPPELLGEVALPLSVWTRSTQVRAVLVPDGVTGDSLRSAPGIESAKLLFGNLIVFDDATWTSAISASVKLAGGRSLAVELPAGPSIAQRGNS